MKNFSHLAINGRQGIIVAVFLHSISLFDSILIAFQGFRNFLHIVICSPKKIVSLHPFVGSAMLVIILNKYLCCGIAGENEVRSILRRGPQQLVAHALTAGALALQPGVGLKIA